MTPVLCVTSYAETKTQISAFVFATKAVHFLYILNFKPPAYICCCTARFVSNLVGTPEDWFCRDTALNFPFYAALKMKNMAVTGCLHHSSRSFKGYVYLFICKQFIITIESNRIETFNWVKWPLSRMGVSDIKPCPQQE